jgi:hypothetical protein
MAVRNVYFLLLAAFAPEELIKVRTKHNVLMDSYAVLLYSGYYLNSST